MVAIRKDIDSGFEFPKEGNKFSSIKDILVDDELTHHLSIKREDIIHFKNVEIVDLTKPKKV